MNINFVNFFWQCAALAVWVFLCAVIYGVAENAIRSRLSDQSRSGGQQG